MPQPHQDTSSCGMALASQTLAGSCAVDFAPVQGYADLSRQSGLCGVEDRAAHGHAHRNNTTGAALSDYLGIESPVASAAPQRIAITHESVKQLFNSTTILE